MSVLTKLFVLDIKKSAYLKYASSPILNTNPIISNDFLEKYFFFNSSYSTIALEIV